MEYINCDLCGSDDYKVICRKARFNRDAFNVLCKKCGLVYINPRMDPAEYREFYKNEYHILYDQSLKPPEEFIKKQLERGRTILNFAGDWLENGVKILDVGCAAGGILKIFKDEKKAEASGIEPSIGYSEYAREKFGLKVFTGTAEEFISGKGKNTEIYDFIILSHVIEHFLSPSKTLKEISTLLKDNGKIYIEVPSIMNPYGKLSYFFEDAHPYTFSPATIRLLLYKTGFRILKFDERSSDYIKLIAQKSNKKENVNYDSGEYKKIIRSLIGYQIYRRQFYLCKQWSYLVVIRIFGENRGKKIWEFFKKWKEKL